MVLLHNQVLNKIKIAVRILSQVGRKYDENMNYGIIDSVLENHAAYSNKLTVKYFATQY